MLCAVMLTTNIGVTAAAAGIGDNPPSAVENGAQPAEVTPAETTAPGGQPGEEPLPPTETTAPEGQPGEEPLPPAETTTPEGQPQQPGQTQNRTKRHEQER